MTTCPILMRIFRVVSMLLLFCVPLVRVLSARQNQSSTQAHPSQSPRPLVEAQSALAHGNAEDAIQILSNYLQAQPEDSDARILLGQAYASIGQNDHAEDALLTALQSAPDNFVALAALGEIYEREGLPSKAEPLLAHAATVSKDVPQIRTEWALVLAQLHKYKEAQSALTGLSPPGGREQRIVFFRLKASVALGLGNASAGASEMEKALALNPTDHALTMATAAAEMQSKNWQRVASLTKPLFSSTRDPRAGLVCLEAELEAHADFHQTLELLRAIQLNSSDELAFRQRVAELLIAHGKYSDSIEDLRAAADLDPSRPELQFNLALAEFRAGLQDDALKSAEKCKELGDNAELEDLIGDIEEARGDNVSAVKSFQSAVALAPNEEKYRLSLAVELMRHSNFEPAKLVLTQAVEMQPNSWRLQLALGMIEYFAGTDEEATRYLLRSAELAPEPESALKYLGDIQMDRSSAPDPAAVAKLCEYSDREPKDGHMQYYCGALLFREGYVSGEKSQAGEILRRLHASVGLIPKDPAPHCQLGKAYRWLERWQEALSESKVCAHMDPDSADAHFRLAQIYQHFGQSEQRQQELKLYEVASKRTADQNARRDAALKTFLITIQNSPADEK